MKTVRLSNDFMDQILTDEAWKELSSSFAWTEQLLDKYKDKVDWKEISGNNVILWTPAMLEKYRRVLDWKELSGSSNDNLFSEEILEKFKDYWDWSELSENMNLELTAELVEKFADCWDWSELINRYREDNLYTFDFFEKYKDKIPAKDIQNSRLWYRLTELRKKEVVSAILS